VIGAHLQHSRTASEAGGVLLGRMLLHSSDVIIDAATAPNPEDQATRVSFHRAVRPAQMAVERAWGETEGRANYLGEWHTHPEDEPSPSRTDVTNWKRIVKTAQYEQDMLFFLIAGRRAIRVWELPRRGRNPAHLAPLDDEPDEEPDAAVGAKTT
jgi:integrative and conjugative element protein (TIGR02256 family)